LFFEKNLKNPLTSLKSNGILIEHPKKEAKASFGADTVRFLKKARKKLKKVFKKGLTNGNWYSIIEKSRARKLVLRIGL
jgi:hypothetical protein